jgi:putative transposase
MPRPPRLDLAGIPQHIVQRAVDRRPCFILEIHYLEYLRHLLEQSERFGCQVHAYALMCNHVHILATPAADGGVGRLMQSVGRRYVGFFNVMMERKGTLWAGRFKSCLGDTNEYLLHCYRYIELNPVRAGITAAPGDYRWNSFGHNGMAKADSLVTPHPTYVALGHSIEERTKAYREFIGRGCDQRQAGEIRAMTSRQRAFGTKAFRERLHAEHGRPMGVLRQGRPRLGSKPEPGV